MSESPTNPEPSPRVNPRLALVYLPQVIGPLLAAIWAFVVVNGTAGLRIAWAVGAGTLAFLAPVMYSLLDRVRHGRIGGDLLFEGRAQFLVEDVRHGPLATGIPGELQREGGPSVLTGVLQIGEQGVTWIPGRIARRRGATTFVLPWATVDSISLGFGPFKGLGSAALELNVHHEWSASFEVLNGPSVYKALDRLDRKIAERIRNGDEPIEVPFENARKGFWHAEPKGAPKEMFPQWRWGLFVAWIALVTMLMQPAPGESEETVGVFAIVVSGIELVGILATLVTLLLAVPVAYVISIVVAGAGVLLSLGDLNYSSSVAATELIAFAAVLMVSLMARAAHARPR